MERTSFITLKEIVNLVSTKGLIKEFILHTDGSVNAVDPSGTLVVILQHNHVNLENDIGIEDSGLLSNTFAKFDNDAQISFIENKLVLNKGGMNAKIPLMDINSIKDFKPTSDFSEFTTKAENVDHKVLKNTLGLKVSGMEDEYHIFNKDGKIRLESGNDNTIGDNIAEIMETVDNHDYMIFSLNISEVISSLKEDCTIILNKDKYLSVSVTNEDYSVKYILAPRIES